MFSSPGTTHSKTSKCLLSVFGFAILSVSILLAASVNVSAQVPTVTLTAPSSSYVNEVVLVDARRSTGISKLPQWDGRPSVTIDFGDGFSANLLAAGHAYRRPGTYTITLTAAAVSGGTAVAERTIVVSSIPAASGSNVQVLTNAGSAVLNAANLQSAINIAAASNGAAEQEIVLPAGAVFAGPITLPPPAGNKYITIRSASLSSLSAGRRVGPGQASLMPIITAPSSTTAVLPALETTRPAPANPSHPYRIQGIHLQKDDETKRVGMLMSIGTDGAVGISKLPHHFIVDRCWFDGGASDTSQVTNGLRIYGNEVSVVDSYAGEFRLVGVGVDTAAITPVTGQGPLAFVNNTMIATSENFNIAGGAAEKGRATISNATTTSCTLSHVINLEVDQDIALPVGGAYRAAQSTIIRSISGNNVTFDPIPNAPDNGGTAEWIAQPSFIEFRGNYLYKPLKWWPRHSSWNGITYQIKNLWETKFSRYVVIDGNVMENSWLADQAYAIALTVRNMNGGESSAASVRELQFSNNIIRNAAAGINILSDDYNTPTQGTSDITFRNNLFQNIGTNFDPTGSAHMLINMQNGSVRLKRIFMIHNTHDNGTPDNSYGMITDFGNNGGADQSMWMNNVHQHGGYGFRSNQSTTNAAANIANFLPPGDGSNWNRNLIVNKGLAIYPSSAVIASGLWPAQFQNYSGGDFTLAANSPGKGMAADGTDIGVDMVKLNAATQGAISGIWDSSPTPTPTPTPIPTPTPTPIPTPTPTPTPIPTPTPTTGNYFQLSSPVFNVFEGGGSAYVTVRRTNSAGAASVDYRTSDTAGLNNCNLVNGVASARCDYTIAVGTLRFVDGESAKSISIPVIEDGYEDGNEAFSITLTNANGAALGSPSVGTITIQDKDSNGTNPIDDTAFFVRQQYLDFLNREPDSGSYAAWQQVINNCQQGNTTCDRIHVSSAFFRSAEFQDRGYFVYRFYPVSFGRKPVYSEFTPDMAKVSVFLSAAELDAAKWAFIAEFMTRPEFVTKFNGLTDAQYVETLLETAGITSPKRDFWIAALGNGTRTRAGVLREISESTEVYNRYYNQAFVVMQYFGYLRRDPDASYLDWIDVLNSSGDFRGMVNGFLNSAEYRSRLGS